MCARLALHAVSVMHCSTLAGSVVFLVTVQFVVSACACISGFTDLAAQTE